MAGINYRKQQFKKKKGLYLEQRISADIKTYNEYKFKYVQITTSTLWHQLLTAVLETCWERQIVHKFCSSATCAVCHARHPPPFALHGLLRRQNTASLFVMSSSNPRGQPERVRPRTHKYCGCISPLPSLCFLKLSLSFSFQCQWVHLGFHFDF